MSSTEPRTGGRAHWREMAALPGRRLFVAVPLPDAIAGPIRDLVERLRDPNPGPGRRRDVRWVRLDGLHLTLRFLGPTDEARVADVRGALAQAAAGVEPFPARVAGGGAFPSPHHPRTLWLAVAEGAAQLQGLAGAVDDALHAAGWPRSDRPFRAHVTLARADGIARGPEVASQLAAEASRLDLPLLVDRIVLFESVTGGGPARYVPLETAHLHAAPRGQ